YLCYAFGEELNYAYFSREYRWWMRRIYDGAAGVISCSHNTERMLLEEWGLPAARVLALHPGVDATRFTLPSSHGEARTRVGWKGRTVLLTVGRLQKRKGHDMLIRALPAVRQEVPDVLYAIVGEGEERPELERLVAEHGLSGHVQFVGEVDDKGLVD